MSGRFLVLAILMSQNFFLPFHNLYLYQPCQREKQTAFQDAIQAGKLKGVEQARKAATFFPVGDHPCAFEVQDFGDILLFHSDSFSVFSQVIRNLSVFDFFHTLLD